MNMIFLGFRLRPSATFTKFAHGEDGLSEIEGQSRTTALRDGVSTSSTPPQGERIEFFARSSGRFIAALGLALSPTPALADALQQQVLAGAKAMSPEDFAFTQTLSNQRSGEPAKDYVLRYDPKRAKGARWTLIRAEGRAPTAKELSSFSKRANAGNVPGYADLAKWFGAPATRTASGPGSVTYRFASLPAGTIKLPGSDISASTSAEAVVNTSGAIPFVERVRITSNKAFRIMMVAKIERFTASSTYQMTSGGRPVIVNTASDMTGSAMGKSGTFKSRAAYSDMRWVR